MITISTQVTGPQIARELCSDAEEMAYALEEMSEQNLQDEAAEIADHLPYGSSDSIIKMLRELADNLASAAQSD